MTGKLIVIDGGEGTGTTSVTKSLAQHFGDKAIATREPGGVKYAEKIRNLILYDEDAGNADTGTLFSLFWAARNEHLVEVVLPALEAGKHVFTDRFDSSTYAYQMYAGNRFDLLPLFEAYRLHLERMGCLPHHYIILDGNPRVCLERAKLRAKLHALHNGQSTDHFEQRPIVYHDAIRKGFLEFVKNEPHDVINAEKPEDIVKHEVLKVVQRVVGVL